MLLDSLAVPSDRFLAETGWELKPEGACKGDVCVPVGRDVAGPDGTVDVRAVAGALGMAVVHDPRAGLWALGPETLGGRALATAVAPELTLDDLDGRPFHLSSLRGRKVVLVAWAPY